MHLTEQPLHGRAGLRLHIPPPAMGAKQVTSSAREARLLDGGEVDTSRAPRAYVRESVAQAAVAVDERALEGVAKKGGGSASGVLAAGRMSVKDRRHDHLAQAFDLAAL